MKIITPKFHGYLDYVVVLSFLAAPMLLGMTGAAAAVSYLLAAVHLVLTLLTNFPLGLMKVLPLKIHGWIELVVAPTLVALPWVLGFSDNEAARDFYIAAGFTVFVTWLLTDYRWDRRERLV